MAVNYESPISIPGAVAEGIQCILSHMNTFSLTTENFDEFVIKNKDLKLVMWTDTDAGTCEPCTAEQLKPLIGFRWSW